MDAIPTISGRSVETLKKELKQRPNVELFRLLFTERQTLRKDYEELLKEFPALLNFQFLLEELKIFCHDDDIVTNFEEKIQKTLAETSKSDVMSLMHWLKNKRFDSIQIKQV